MLLRDGEPVPDLTFGELMELYRGQNQAESDAKHIPRVRVRSVRRARAPKFTSQAKMRLRMRRVKPRNASSSTSLLRAPLSVRTMPTPAVTAPGGLGNLKRLALLVLGLFVVALVTFWVRNQHDLDRAQPFAVKGALWTSVCHLGLVQRRFPSFCGAIEYNVITDAVNALLPTYRKEIFSACERSFSDFALRLVTVPVWGLGKLVFGIDSAAIELSQCRERTLPISRAFPGTVLGYIRNSGYSLNAASTRALREIVSRAAGEAHEEALAKIANRILQSDSKAAFAFVTGNQLVWGASKAWALWEGASMGCGRGLGAGFAEYLKDALAPARWITSKLF